MGRKSWFSSVKKAFSPDSAEKKAKESSKSKKKWFGTEKPPVSGTPNLESIEISYPHPIPLLEEVNAVEPVNHDCSVAEETTAEDDVTMAHASPQVFQPSSQIRFPGKSEEEVAAIKVQTAFRGYLARRALRALKGLVRLKSLVDGPIVNRQTANTLKSMQTLSRVQSQIQSRRIRMLEENRALQRQLLQKRAKELESLKMGEEWDDSLQSKEQIEASLLYKYEAAMRRERALAYSYTHQQTWKKPKSSNLLFMDPTNPHWGWSWLERWTAAQPWLEKDLNSDRISTKNANIGTSGGEIIKSFASHQLNNSEMSSSPINQKPNSNQSPATSSLKPASSSFGGKKMKPVSSKAIGSTQEDDSRSLQSIQSERNRRHSITGSSIKDDDSIGSYASVPSYMASTKSAKAKSKLGDTIVMDNGSSMDKGSVKKRLSFPPSPGKLRRHSDPPPKVESFPVIARS